MTALRVEGLQGKLSKVGWFGSERWGKGLPARGNLRQKCQVYSGTSLQVRGAEAKMQL